MKRLYRLLEEQWEDGNYHLGFRLEGCSHQHVFVRLLLGAWMLGLRAYGLENLGLIIFVTLS